MTTSGKMRFVYEYRINSDGEDRYLEFDQLPEIVCAVNQEDLDEGRIYEIAIDAVRNAIQARMDYQDEIPSSDNVSDSTVVALSPLDAVKVMLYLECVRRKWNKAQFAREIGTTATTAKRLLDLFHESRFDLLLHAIRKMGLRLESEFQLRPSDEVRRA